jgi:hypothetical protein
LPDLYLGRLPANSAAEVTAMVSKIVAYEQTPVADWNHKILFATDNEPDYAGPFYPYSNDIVNNHVPAGYTADKVYLGDNYPSATAARTAIINAINDGRLLVQYIGHGWPDHWAGESILRRDDISTLTNAGKYPVFLDMTCQTGYFIDPTNTSIAEAAVRAGGKGVIASFTPTGWGTVPDHHYLNTAFFDALFKDNIRHLGPATLAAKLNLYHSSADQRLLDTFTILGDPALNLAVPGCALRWDVDNDQKVTIRDVQMIASRWGAKLPDPGYAVAYDVDENFEIDTADIQTAADHWRETCP